MMLYLPQTSRQIFKLPTKNVYIYIYIYIYIVIYMYICIYIYIMLMYKNFLMLIRAFDME